MLDTIIHRWLKVPYALHAEVFASEQKSIATILFIHGIGDKGRAWDEVIAKLLKNLKVVTVDLLGFGQSPSPSWAVYRARTQARSVLAGHEIRGLMVDETVKAISQPIIKSYNRD